MEQNVLVDFKQKENAKTHILFGMAEHVFACQDIGH